MQISLDDYTRAPGSFGVFDLATSSFTRVGDVVNIDKQARMVERVIDPPHTDHPGLGPVVDWTPDVFFNPSALDREFREVAVPTMFGTAPAWVFDGWDPSTWVIHVHGSWTDRSIMFRDVSAFSGLGFTSLVPSFRSDAEVSPVQPEVSHLGQTEWLDLEAAISYARAHGAEWIILSGWSMGGTMALLAAERSAHRELIAAVVLDGPVTSWRKAISAGAAKAGVPQAGANVVMALLGRRFFARALGLAEPIDFDALEWVDRPGRVGIPTLVLHSRGDQEVPWELSVAFQQANPGYVTLVQLPESQHTQEWNTSPSIFTEELTRWIERTLRED